VEGELRFAAGLSETEFAALTRIKYQINLAGVAQVSQRRGKLRVIMDSNENGMGGRIEAVLAKFRDEKSPNKS
jgi:hypothetical protein